MYELKQVGERTYYIDSPTRMGIYQLDNGEVCLIDSGNDKDAGKKVQNILRENNWKLNRIINTHSHADHIGGNHLLQEREECKIYCRGVDRALVEYPILEPAFLYGSYPNHEIQNKFLLAKESRVEELSKEILPEGLEMVDLNGHSFSMVGIKTKDDVWFLGDSVASHDTIQKHHITFLYNVEEYFHSLDVVEKLEGKLFIPSHMDPVEDIKPYVQENREKMQEIIEEILNYAGTPCTFEVLLQHMFMHYGLHMNFTQYVLIGSTLKAYLSYLYEQEKLEAIFENSQLLWKTKKEG